MADPIGEERQALERLIQQKFDSLAASLGIEATTGVINPTNPNAVGPDAQADQSFTTAYSGGLTVTVALWDYSSWDGGDVWSS